MAAATKGRPAIGGRLAIAQSPCQSARFVTDANRQPTRSSSPSTARRPAARARSPARWPTHFGLPHMDTGHALPGGGAEHVPFRRRSRQRVRGGPRLRPASARSTRPIPNCAARSVGSIASRISAYPAVRAALLERQRDFAGQQRRRGARRPRHRHGDRAGADVKLFVTASAEVRARRRVAELLARGMPAHYDDVLIDIRARDERDAGRDSRAA